MTKQELLIRLNTILEGYEQRIAMLEPYRRSGVPDSTGHITVSAAGVCGEFDCLLMVASDLEALILEGVQP